MHYSAISCIAFQAHKNGSWDSSKFEILYLNSWNKRKEKVNRFEHDLIKSMSFFRKSQEISQANFFVLISSNKLTKGQLISNKIVFPISALASKIGGIKKVKTD